MNYLDIREEQGTLYFIIRLYLNKEKKLSQVSLHMDFNYYFKIVVYCAYFLFPNFIPMLETTYLDILYHIISCCTYIHKLQFHLLT